MDIVGSDGVGADAEVLAVALDALRGLGLGADEVRARVSDRRLLAALLGAAGVEPDRLLAAYGVIDKLERESRDRTRERLVNEAGLSSEGVQSVLGLFDEPGLASVETVFGDRDEVAAEIERLREYMVTLEAMELGEFVEFDLSIVRGLAYYTGIVFEIFDRSGEFRAICGGGRYDRLLERVGGEDLPAVGFGMGDVVLTELLRDRGRLPDVSRHLDYYLVHIGEETRPRMLTLAHRLRDRGATVGHRLQPAGVRKQFRAAETQGAERVVVLGPDELARGVVTLRNMADGREQEVSLESLEQGS